jgi:hypothetical protein
LIGGLPTIKVDNALSMLTVIQAFKDNVKEVENYFLLLQKIEDGYSSLQDGSGSTFHIDSDLSRILKANAVLIIYNLIEATIKNGLWELFENMKLDNLAYPALIEQIQLLWIDQRIKLEFKTKDETINSQIMNVIDAAMKQSLTYYRDKKLLKFDAGTLDVRGINTTFKRHGLSAISAHSLISESFSNIKTNRNNLAHGDKTFIDCGRDYSFRDLRTIKIHVERFLMKSLMEIKTFIDTKKYRRPGDCKLNCVKG